MNAHDQLLAHVELVQKWNTTAALVSKRDLGSLVDAHVVDSLSLGRYVFDDHGKASLLLDVGSGGGFPGLVLAASIEGLDVVLLERSEKKAAFLRQAVRALGLDGVRVIQGEFPSAIEKEGLLPTCLTARAVERPEKVVRQILSFLPENCTFLCQSGEPASGWPKRFHVEHVRDIWSERGLRRGELHLVRGASVTSVPRGTGPGLPLQAR